MRVEIHQKCSSKYTLLLRIYCGMSAFVSMCVAITLHIWGFSGGAFAAAGVFAAMCCAAVVLPMSCGRISYTRSGGCLRVEKGIFVRRTVIVNRSDIRCSEIKIGMIQRRLGLCTVVFFTGGGNVKLRGVNVDDGRLLNRLMGAEALG